MKPALTAQVLRALADALEAQPEIGPDPNEELTLRQVAKLLHRSPEWVANHAAELGGYQEGGPGSDRHFPRWGIQRFQESRRGGGLRRVS